jgi:predicted aldo/keto reductase-like oxidoreductase
MEYGRLGRTGLKVSRIGLGTEHLCGQPRETVCAVIRRAVERGVNYFDLVYSLPHYLDDMQHAFLGLRDRVLLTAHLGSTEKDGQYNKSRSVVQCERSFLDLLRRLETDYVDVLFLHNFNSLKDWDQVASPDRALDLALRLQDEGKARCLGISAHYPDVVQKAIETGNVDVVLFPINLFGHAMPGRQQLQDLCVQHEIGLVAMKPFGGGKLLTQRGRFRVPKYQTAGQAFKARIDTEITPVQCLSYTLAQVGISMALPGVKNAPELEAALAYLEATTGERDFSGLLNHFGRYVEGECVYCNHCLPCPVHIDIAQVNRLLDAAEGGLTPGLRAAYRALPARATACTGCGACTERCPFGVNVVARMRTAQVVLAA